MSEWRTTTWGEVITLQRGHDITKSVQVLDGPVPVVSSGGIESRHDVAISDGPGVVIGRKGTLGRVHYVDGPFWPHDTTLWVTDFKGNEPRFVYYALTLMDPASFDVGSASPTLNRNHVHPLPVRWPVAHADQRAIAGLLGALDDKIAANTRCAVLLDELVRTGFAALGGEPRPLARIAEHVRHPVDPAEVDPATRYVGLEHVPRRHAWLDAGGVAGEAVSTKASFVAGDVLFGKLRPNFHKVVAAPVAGICSTDILVLRARDPALRGYLLAAASADATVAAVTASVQGTRMPRTNWSDLGEVAVPWPGEAQARAFGADVDRMADLAARLADESSALARTRDELLPLLMSGAVAPAHVPTAHVPTAQVPTAHMPTA